MTKIAGILFFLWSMGVSLYSPAQEVKSFKRAVLVEEFSFTSCGHCPRGHAGMERLRNQYGDAFVGVALHRSSTEDPMYLAHYADLKVEATPLCKIDRSVENYTPEVANLAFARALGTPAKIGIELIGTLDEANKTVNVSATIDSQLEGLAEITFVLVADHLVGQTPDWLQANYMAEEVYQGETDDPVLRFYKGGSCATNPYTQIYDDVAITSSYDKDGHTLVPPLHLQVGQKTKSMHRLILPTNAKLTEALKNSELFVIAFVTDAAGSVLNAAKVPVRLMPKGSALVVVNQSLINGEIIAFPSGRVQAGDKVKLTPTPNKGYQVKTGSLKVYRADGIGEALEVEQREGETTFIMPAYNVIVNASFEVADNTQKTYQVKIDGDIKHGAIVVSPMHDVTAGTLLTVELKPVSGYRYKGCSLRYYKTNAPGLVVHLPKETFKMPDYDITLTADFERTGSSEEQGGLPEASGDGTGIVVTDFDKSSVEIIPNPFASTLKLVRDNDTNISALRYELVNAQGQVVCAGIFNGGETQIDTQNLPEGLYVVRILLPDLGTGKTFRVIKK